jgi:hypothetical protein
MLRTNLSLCGCICVHPYPCPVRSCIARYCSQTWEKAEKRSRSISFKFCSVRQSLLYLSSSTFFFLKDISSAAHSASFCWMSLVVAHCHWCKLGRFNFHYKIGFTCFMLEFNFCNAGNECSNIESVLLGSSLFRWHNED